VSWLGHLPGGYNDWRVALGASAHLGRAGVALLVAAAAVAIALSALSLIEERHGRGALLLVLRAAGVLACLITALEPTVELRQVTHVPNRVAILVDASRSMEVRPPSGGASRADRAAALIDAAGPELAALQRDGHDVDLFTFSDALTPANRESLHARLPRIAERPFDSDRKRMTTVHRDAGGSVRVVCKGAPEELLSAGLLTEDDALLARAVQRAGQWASEGLRVLAVAAADHELAARLWAEAGYELKAKTHASLVEAVTAEMIEAAEEDV